MLFVICLVLRATTLSMLAWRVTGFTIGHSVTLPSDSSAVCRRELGGPLPCVLVPLWTGERGSQFFSSL